MRLERLLSVLLSACIPRRPQTEVTMKAMAILLTALVAITAGAGAETTVPLHFTPNQGQWDSRILYRAEANGAILWYTADGAYYQFIRRCSTDTSASGTDFISGVMAGELGRQAVEYSLIKAQFVGANPDPYVSREGELFSRCNYFLGRDPSRWATDVPNYASIVYGDIYPGIDLKYYGNSEHMEYDFIVSPGANPDRIKIRYEGVNSLAVNQEGELVISTIWGDVVERTPVVYQMNGTERRFISGEYQMVDAQTFGFKMSDDYNPDLALVIDPVLTYSSYLGGSGEDAGNGITVDDDGNAYIVGYTNSVTFPENPVLQENLAGEKDIFILKLRPSGDPGTQLLYSTYLGGGGDDVGVDIVLTESGNIIITGFTTSDDFPLSTTIPPYLDENVAGDTDIVLVQLNASGTELVYSSYLGGNTVENHPDMPTALCLDVNGYACIAGWTESPDYPIEGTFYQDVYGGHRAGFVTKLQFAETPANQIVYSTYFGGGDSYEINGMAIDAQNRVYVAGTENPAGNARAFVAKFNSGGDALEFSRTLSGGDVFSGSWAGDIVVDGEGCPYVVGRTQGSHFPTLNAIQDTPMCFRRDYNGGDLFICKLTADGSELLFSTYFGGYYIDLPMAMAIDHRANIHITGVTFSNDFPQTYSHNDGTVFEEACLFYMKVDSAGGLRYSTAFSETLNPLYPLGFLGTGVAIDDVGNAYITGSVASDGLLTTENAFQASYQGELDAFVMKFFEPETNPTLNVTKIEDDGSAGTLRWAINQANLSTGPDVIEFQVSGTITLESELPAINGYAGGVWINGSSAPGGPHSIVLDGNNVTGNGLTLLESDNEIDGLVIINFDGAGIEIQSSANKIDDNLIGITAANIPAGNGSYGVLIGGAKQGSTTSLNFIGTRNGNVISGNGAGGVSGMNATIITKSYIGTDLNGSVAVPNAGNGISLNGGYYIRSSITDNIVSGNMAHGIEIGGGGVCLISRNWIGTDKNAEYRIANGGDGIHATGMIKKISENVISGNSGNGIWCTGLQFYWMYGIDVIRANFIGTNDANSDQIPNDLSGVAITGYGDRDSVLIGPCGEKIADYQTCDEEDANVISGNGLYGICIYNKSGYDGGIMITENYIGVGLDGETAIPNNVGISVSDLSTFLCIGDCSPNYGINNIISANRESGIVISNSSLISLGGNTLAGNAENGIYVGNSSHVGLRRNILTGNAENGIDLDNSTNLYMYANRLENNGKHGSSETRGGIYFHNGSTQCHLSGDTVRGNYRGIVLQDDNTDFIELVPDCVRGSDVGPDIDLWPEGVTVNDDPDDDVGPNENLNYPEFSVNVNSLCVTSGIGPPNGAVHFYLVENVSHPPGDDATYHSKRAKGDFGGALRYLGSVECDGSGYFVSTTCFSSDVVGFGDWITALAVDENGNTSEFCRNVAFVPASATTTCPVHLVVIDPAGDSIGLGFNTIVGAEYDDWSDVDGDGSPDDRVLLQCQLSGTYQIRVIPDVDAQPEDTYSLLFVSGDDSTALVNEEPVPEPGGSDDFEYDASTGVSVLCGDANADEAINIADAVHLINYIFKGGPAPDPLCVGDATGDGAVNIGDAVHLINYIFKGGPAPVEDCCP